MFGFTGPELLLTAVIGLLILGPDQLKQVVRFIAKMVKGIRNFFGEVSEYLESSIDDNKHQSKYK